MDKFWQTSRNCEVKYQKIQQQYLWRDVNISSLIDLSRMHSSTTSVFYFISSVQLWPNSFIKTTVLKGQCLPADTV